MVYEEASRRHACRHAQTAGKGRRLGPELLQSAIVEFPAARLVAGPHRPVGHRPVPFVAHWTEYYLDRTSKHHGRGNRGWKNS